MSENKYDGLNIDETPATIELGRQAALTVLSGLPGFSGMVRMLDTIESQAAISEVKGQLQFVYKEIADLHGRINDLQIAKIIQTIGPVVGGPQIRKPEFSLKIMKELNQRSENAQVWDPSVDIEEMAKIFGEMPQPEADRLIKMVAHELDDLGWIHKHTAIGYRLGFNAIGPKPIFFAETDSIFQPWDPKADAKMVLSKVIASGETSINFHNVEKENGWTPRRINPMIAFMEYSRYIKETHAYGGMKLNAPYAYLDDEAYFFVEDQ